MGATEKEKIILRALAMSSASLSIVAGALMMYWFLKLKRRSFRHQLVMLLIISDFFKAVCEVVYPAATIASGSTASGPLCTTTGFFATTFVNATDFAVLVIAIHTAVCIFRPSQGGLGAEEAGLYRWRYQVYVCWALYSVTLASLAFLNTNTAYTSSVSWCFLPIRPFYWRISLSWGPRYAILLFIFILYLTIFIYVKRKFNSFRQMFATSVLDVDSSSLDTSETDFGVVESGQVTPLVKELKTHNLLDARQPQSPLYSNVNSLQSGVNDYFMHPARLGSAAGQTDETLVEGVPSVFAPREYRKQSVISINLPEQLQSRRTSVVSLDRGVGPGGRARPFSEERDSLAGHSPRNANDRMDPLRLQRARIVKQLKHLFIFPVVYLLMWIIPFCYHMTQYHDRYALDPVIGLAAVAAFIIPLHGFIDVLVYAQNEKPWRSWRFRHSAAGRQVDQQDTDRGTASSSAAAAAAVSSSTGGGDPTDSVARRHEDEIREAELKRISRRSERALEVRESGPRDWWDLETEKYDIMDGDSSSG